MKMLKMLFFSGLAVAAMGCGSGDKKEGEEGGRKTTAEKMAEKLKDGKGLGEIKNVTLTDPLEASMVTSGKAIYEMKCSACHKLTDQKVVGPGWQGLTNRRKPEWVMNMVTNVDVMLDKDPAAQALLEECLTRMPNQNVSVGDARALLEFMRHNDMEKAGSKDGAASK